MQPDSTIFNKKKTNKFLFVQAALLLALVLLFMADLTLGSVNIPLAAVFKTLTGQALEKKAWQQIVWEFRMPRAITAILTGAALAVSGLQMQTLFRNPLAGPFVLGISSGASLGVAIIVLAGSALAIPFITINNWLIAAASSVGSFLVLLLVVLVSLRVKDSMTLLIVGLMFGAIGSALVDVLQFFSEADQIQAFLIWTFGSLGGVTWPELQVLVAIVLLGLLISVFLAKPLNALLLGEHYAESMGLSLQRARFGLILSTSLLAGGITAFCGPIAFIGLAVPHLTRLIFDTSNHQRLIPSVVLSGAILMLICDILSQLPGSEQVLPINAVTSLFGAPVVLWLILQQRNLSRVF